MPHAEHFDEDLEIFYAFFEALASGVKTLPDKEFSAADKSNWEKASKYIQLRR
jgi:hypothetical protein